MFIAVGPQFERPPRGAKNQASKASGVFRSTKLSRVESLLEPHNGCSNSYYCMQITYSLTI